MAPGQALGASVRASCRRSAAFISRRSDSLITIGNPSQLARGYYNRRSLDVVDAELVYAHVGFGAEAVDYRQAWETQRAVHGRRVLGEIPDCCLLLEHSPVYTAGKRTAVSDRPFGDPRAPVIAVARAGKTPWPGPGQLTASPIVKLREPMDVVAYVRALEEAMIAVCDEFGLEAIRVEGRSGAWLPASAGQPERKVGAIGARVARGVTMHGLALNCDCDLSWYDRIVPCGIRDAGVTSLSAETGRGITFADVTPVLERHLAAALGYRTWRRIHTVAPLLASAA